MCFLNDSCFQVVEEAGENEGKELKGKVVKFGWLDGVYMRCLLNIWGVMLFLRLTWVVGQGGVIQGLLVILLCNVVTTITAVSMSAVSTNGQIKGGGIYYMISRSLGPEFGGAIGIMFTIANSIAVSMYIIGFCDSLNDMLKEYVQGFDGIIGAPIDDVRLIGSITLIVVLLIAIVGMDWVTRVQLLLLGLLIVSQFDFMIGTIIGPAEGEEKYGFTGYKLETLKASIHSDYHNHENPGEKVDFFTLFGVFFPAVTGIVAGANLSGDLKDPAVAIPKGTLLAILTTFLTYIGYGVMIAGSGISQASGNATEYNATISGNISDTVLAYDNCNYDQRKILGETLNQTMQCQFGTSNDRQMMAKMSWSGYLIFAGCFAATLSSAIASLVGAPRVLQALAKDKLYPLIHVFSKGYGANNDPFRGYILVFFISLGCILIGELDVVATLLSNFFVAAYALINFSVFHASITKSPGWRPSFKYYNMWVSLLGTVLCVAVMFLMDWKTALITFGIVAVLYFYISYRNPEANWGSSTQAQQFVTTLKNCHTLNEMPEHVKNYRPRILVFSGVPAHRQPLVDFANLITKKLSLLICAHVEENQGYQYLDALRSNTNLWLKDHHIKAFFNAVPSLDFEQGAKSVMNACGLGKMVPNMVLLGFKNDWITNIQETDGYINVLHHALDMHLAVGVLKLQDGCDYSAVIGQDEVLDNEEVLENEVKEEEKKDDESDNNVEVEIKGTTEKTATDNEDHRKSANLYHDADGNPLEKKIMDSITQFQVSFNFKLFEYCCKQSFQAKKRKGNIDVWWLYDDGGLTLLLPYILTTRAQFADCSMRIFALANRRDELDRETRK